MKFKSKRQKWVVLSIVMLPLLVAVLYQLALFRAEKLLSNAVEEHTDGKLHLDVKKVKFTLLDLRFDFQQVELTTNDTIVPAYHIKTERILLNVNSLMSVYVGRRIDVDSIRIVKPEVGIVKKSKHVHEKHSLSAELNRAFEALRKVLARVRLRSFRIENASFALYQNTLDDPHPLSLKNVYLTVDEFTRENVGQQTKFLYSDRVLLNIFDADMAYAEGRGRIAFKRLSVNTASNTVKLDSCLIYNQSLKHQGNYLQVFIDSVRLIRLDFNKLVNENQLIFDSAYCVNPVTDLVLNLPEKDETQPKASQLLTQSRLDHKIVDITGPVYSGHLALQNAKVSLLLNQGVKQTHIAFDQSGFVFDSLVMNHHSREPVYAKKMRVDIRNHTFITPDSLYQLRFDALSLMNKKIILDNVSLMPAKKGSKAHIQSLRAQRFELDSMSWGTLLAQSKIDATKALLVEPELEMRSSNKAASVDTPNDDNPEIIDLLRHVVKLRALDIQNGNFSIGLKEQGRLSIKDLNVSIFPDILLRPQSQWSFLNGIQEIAFSSATIRQKQASIFLRKGVLSGTSGVVQLAGFGFIKKENKDYIDLNQLKISGIYADSTGVLHIGALRYGSLEGKWSQLDNAATQPKSQSSLPPVLIGSVQGGKTQLDVEAAKMRLSVSLHQLGLFDFRLLKDAKPSFRYLEMVGDYVGVALASGLNAEFAEFSIKNQKASVIHDATLRLPFKNKQLHIKIPEISFALNLQQLVGGRVEGDFIKLLNPDISLDTIDLKEPIAATTSKSTKTPDLRLDQVVLSGIKTSQLMNLLPNPISLGESQLNLHLSGLQSKEGQWTTDSLKVEMASQDQPGTESKTMMLQMKFDQLFFQPAHEGHQSKWGFNLHEATIQDLPLSQILNDTGDRKLFVKRLKVNNLRLNSAKTDIRQLLYNDGVGLSVSEGFLTFTTPKNTIEVFNLNIDGGKQTLKTDSLLFQPAMSQDDFIQSNAYQSVYMKVNSGKLQMNHLDLQRLVSNKELRARSIALDGLKLYTFKDKRLPFKHGVVKPMLTEMLQRIPVNMAVDSIRFADSRIIYEEINDKTLQHGQILLNGLKGYATNIKSGQFGMADSLQLKAFVRLYDTIKLRMGYKQSYADSLNGFKLNLIANAFDIRSLNPMLQPFASANIRSGWLDTLRMSTVGRKYVAFGVMKMYYNELNVELIQKGDTTRKTFLTKTLSFFANRVVHKRNRWGKGSVYAERDFEKGFVNYWVKIVIGGVLTNTGAVSDKRQERKYRHAIKKHEVPPIEHIPVDY